jgi:hypothetical protein
VKRDSTYAEVRCDEYSCDRCDAPVAGVEFDRYRNCASRSSIGARLETLTTLQPSEVLRSVVASLQIDLLFQLLQYPVVVEI